MLAWQISDTMEEFDIQRDSEAFGDILGGPTKARYLKGHVDNPSDLAAPGQLRGGGGLIPNWDSGYTKIQLTRVLL